MGTTVFERQAPPRDQVRAMLAPSALRPFWIDDAPAATYAPLATDASADLVVVGGGYTGLWTALLAKERHPDRSVMVLEAGRVGGAASGRNGGFCEPSLTHGRANGLARWPDEIDALERLGSQNLDELEAAVARYGIDAHFHRAGELTVAVEPHQVAWLGDDALDADAVRALVDSPTYLGGEVDDEVALVHPYRLATELARAATELGVAIHEGTRVRRLERGAVVTETGRVRAGSIALATNVFPSLLRRNALRTVPVYDYAIVTAPLSDAQLDAIGWRSGHGVADMANQFHYYRLTPDRRILFGGYDAVYHPGGRIRPQYEDRAATYEALASHLLTTFPQLAGIAVTHRWAGVIDTCTRFSAFFGAARGGSVAYAAGYTGLGVGASRFGAQVMLDVLEGLDTERTRLEMVRTRPLPFPPEPLASVGIGLTQRALHRSDRREGRRGLFLGALDRVGLGFDS